MSAVKEKPLIISQWTPYLIFIAAAFRFINLGFGEMQQWDESLYALRSLAVNQFGDCVDQSSHMLGGMYYSVHPPLYVWMSSLFLFFFGDHVWIFRLTSALFGGALVILAYKFIKRISSPNIALLTALFIGFNPLITFYSRQGQLDLLLTFLMFVYIYCFVCYIEERKMIFLLLGSFILGCAFMTKLFFVLGIPVAMIGLYFFTRRNKRTIHHVIENDTKYFSSEHDTHSGSTRYYSTVQLHFIIYSLLLSSFIWIPWYFFFTMQHGNGNPFFLLSIATPLGKTISGAEGTPKDLGIFYYLNQLIIQLSFLFPVAAAGMYNALFEKKNITRKIFAIIIVVYLMVITIMQSKFLVYIIPILPMIIFLGIQTLCRVRFWTEREKLWTAILMGLCTIWSLSLDWRMSVKSIFHSIRHFDLIQHNVWISFSVLIALFVFMIIIGVVLYKKGKIDFLFSQNTISFLACGLGIITFTQTTLVHPQEYIDGAEVITQELFQRKFNSVVFIGNGINPQLTYYLHGTDIGWDAKNRTEFKRMEPSEIGVHEIKRLLNDLHLKNKSLGVVIEKDEIAEGMYRSYRDIVSSDYTIIKDTKRYTLLSIP